VAKRVSLDGGELVASVVLDDLVFDCIDEDCFQCAGASAADYRRQHLPRSH